MEVITNNQNNITTYTDYKQTNKQVKNNRSEEELQSGLARRLSIINTSHFQTVAV